jgi:selenocysteine-specific elongation factor
MRIRFTGALPLIPGDRFLLRRTGDDTTVAGGSILDVKPVVRTTRAIPEGTLESILEHHGWLPLTKAQQLVGRTLSPVVGDWMASQKTVIATTDSLLQLLREKQEVDISQLQPWERDLIITLPQVTISQSIATLEIANPLQSHPYVQLFLTAGILTPDTKNLDRDIIRRLTREGIIYEHDNIAFHVDSLRNLRPTLERLWNANPQGFTVGHLRETLNITRKHAVPLATCLDKVGLTKRAGDMRVPGSAW